MSFFDFIKDLLRGIDTCFREGGFISRVLSWFSRDPAVEHQVDADAEGSSVDPEPLLSSTVVTSQPLLTPVLKRTQEQVKNHLPNHQKLSSIVKTQRTQRRTLNRPSPLYYCPHYSASPAPMIG